MKKAVLFILTFIVCFAAISWDASALRITLKRIVFEGSKRADAITVMNSKTRPVTYRIGWRHFQMTEDKALEPIKPGAPLPPGIKPVTEMVRFAPRRFTVPPLSSQQVRIMFRSPKGLEDGEYRSHLWIRPEADLEDLKKKTEKKADGSSGVALTMLTGITMPVIVRKGNLEATLSFENLTAVDRGDVIDVSFTLVREGNRSVYGDVVYTCNEGLSGYELRANRGIAMYTEAPRRNFKVEAKKKPDQSACNSLTLSFVERVGFTGETLGSVTESSVSVK